MYVCTQVYNTSEYEAQRFSLCFYTQLNFGYSRTSNKSYNNNKGKKSLLSTKQLNSNEHLNPFALDTHNPYMQIHPMRLSHYETVSLLQNTNRNQTILATTIIPITRCKMYNSLGKGNTQSMQSGESLQSECISQSICQIQYIMDVLCILFEVIWRLAFI